MFYLRLFLIPWFATLIIEEIVSLIWGHRTIKDVLTVVWINTITNPLVTLIRYVCAQQIPSQGIRILILVAAEILVVLAEWRLFRKFMSEGRYFFLFSVVMNAASYGFGLLVPSILILLRTS